MLNTTTRRLVHSVAAKGFVNGALYDGARPDFPAALVPLLHPSAAAVSAASAAAGVAIDQANTPVLEVGAGTGKLTSLLVNNASLRGLVCVEPSAGFRETFRARFPAVPCLEATASALPFPDGKFSAVYIAQAFHWFADLPSLRELRRVLVPAGALNLIWNLEDGSVPWVRKLRDLYEPYEMDTPQYHRRKLTVENTEQIWTRVLSKSYIQMLPEKEKDSLRERVLTLLTDRDSELERDPAGRILYPYVTDLWVAVAK
ncbi:hypothetical protein HK405_014042 [Cladochytrium tenue]|nr:hypothetical protein HK405_014042 [Cladochytrium tenue]